MTDANRLLHTNCWCQLPPFQRAFREEFWARVRETRADLARVLGPLPPARPRGRVWWEVVLDLLGWQT